MSDSGFAKLNGAWISSEDLHLNRLMREKRGDTLCKKLSAVIVIAMIVFAVVIKWG
jgi:hypothetical protein